MSGYLRKMARNQLRVGNSRRRRTIRDHEDVLQNIEFTLVNAHRQFPEVDDHVCHLAIESALSGMAANNAMAAVLAANLGRVRERRSDVSDAVWPDALRVVADSIRLHSSRRPGEINYLDFVGFFMP